MAITNLSEHLRCFNYDNSDKPAIQTVKFVKGSAGNSAVHSNEIICIMEGRIRFSSKNYPQHEGIKGQIFFLPIASNYAYEAMANSMVVVFRISSPIILCQNISLENLYKANRQNDNEYDPLTKNVGKLEMNARLWHLMDGIVDCLADDIKCRSWMEMKINEFFLLLRIYYAKEDIYDFLFLILSCNTTFSEQVRLHWKRFQTVNQLAEFLNYTPKQFTTRFTAVFGQTPYKWMLEGRARIVHTEITTTNKQFKQIAQDNGFTSDSAFTRFCKNELGKTPSQIREEKQKKILQTTKKKLTYGG